LNVKKRILSVAWYVVSAPFVLLFVITLLYSRHFPEANLVAIQYAADMNGPDLGPVLIAMVIKALLLSGLVLLGLWSVRRIVGRLDLEIRFKLQRVTKVIVVPRIVGTIGISVPWIPYHPYSIALASPMTLRGSVSADRYSRIPKRY